MSHTLARNIVLGVIAAIVITSGAILITALTGNPKSDPTDAETAAVEGNSDEPANTAEPKPEHPNLKDVAKHFSGRTIPKEPLPDNDLVRPQENTTTETTPPTNKPPEKIINILRKKETTTEPVLTKDTNLPVTPPIPDEPKPKTESTPQNTQPKTNPPINTPTTPTPPIPSVLPKKDNIEITQNTTKTPIENPTTPPANTPTTTPTPVDTKKPEPPAHTATLPDNKTTTPTTSTTPPNQPIQLNQNVPSILAPSFPPILLPPPMWVYDYSTGTIGVYYFSPINPQQVNPPNTTINSTTPFTPRPVSPFQLIPAPIYSTPYQPIPIRQPQPIIIFR
jgi:hypothetical protein